ncbi:flagellar export protein FliJ [Photobacterium sp.]|uniref:flagellar export protein FliJ n=1 Tax=Photobacterium sp. TaxID=660 RepID=UPI00299CF261|nr:flagellar export protein FliJ [Photobacterium sp.]MDX1301063.1 flagellar export protein FliJ [Photobacterium sp.]
MNNMVKAVGKLQQLAEKDRERQGKSYKLHQQQIGYFQQQLDELSLLKSGSSEGYTSIANGITLQNNTRVQVMLSRMIDHQLHEMAVMDAECQRAKSQLEASHARVKGLETVLDRWKAKQQYEQAKKEQKQIEDLISARYKRKRV